jgi:Arc/MetJ family transcription regulator
VKRPAGERESGNPGKKRADDILSLIESDLTIQEVAERLGVSVEAARTLVEASLRSKHEEDRRAQLESALLRKAGFEQVREDGSLWEKDGACYGREAASQKAWRVLREGDEDPSGW